MHKDQHTSENGRSDDDATVLPFRPTRSSTPDTWRVERIDTEPMTAQQYDQAVTTLAALISQWNNNCGNADEPHEKAA